MNLHINKQAAGIFAGAMTAFGIGGATGYFIAQKKLETKYDKIAQEQIAAAKTFYSALYKKDGFETPEAARLHLVDEAELLKFEAAKALRDYQGVRTTEDIDTHEAEEDGTIMTSEVQEPIKMNVFEEAEKAEVEDDDFDYEWELQNRDPEKPYVISHDEFMQGDEDYEQVTLTYFEGDDVLTDDKDQPIEEIDRTVGNENLTKFGHGSKDNKIVYVRNDRLSIDFEVVRSRGKYTEEVLGFIKHSDRRRDIRRFRGDDE